MRLHWSDSQSCPTQCNVQRLPDRLVCSGRPADCMQLLLIICPLRLVGSAGPPGNDKMRHHVTCDVSAHLQQQQQLAPDATVRRHRLSFNWCLLCWPDSRPTETDQRDRSDHSRLDKDSHSTPPLRHTKINVIWYTQAYVYSWVKTVTKSPN